MSDYGQERNRAKERQHDNIFVKLQVAEKRIADLEGELYTQESDTDYWKQHAERLQAEVERLRVFKAAYHVMTQFINERITPEGEP